VGALSGSVVPVSFTEVGGVIACLRVRDKGWQFWMQLIMAAYRKQGHFQ
jgi:hypothetical protein